MFALTVQAKAQKGFDFSRKRCLYKWISEKNSLYVASLIGYVSNDSVTCVVKKILGGRKLIVEETAYHSEKKTRKQRLLPTPLKIIGFSQKVAASCFFFELYKSTTKGVRHLHIFTCLPGHSRDTSAKAKCFSANFLGNALPKRAQRKPQVQRPSFGIGSQVKGKNSEKIGGKLWMPVGSMGLAKDGISTYING